MVSCLRGFKNLLSLVYVFCHRALEIRKYSHGIMNGCVGRVNLLCISILILVFTYLIA